MKDSSADDKWLSAIRFLSKKEMARGCKLSNKKEVASCRQIPKLKGSG
jgi:hypothetical protein